MLQNAYLVAKIGADAAENEPHFAEILPKTGNYPSPERLLQPRRRSGDGAEGRTLIPGSRTSGAHAQASPSGRAV